MGVRFAQYNDFEGIMKLYEFLVEEDERGEECKMRRIWDDIMQHRDTYRYAVAEENGVVVTACNITIVQNLTRGGRPFAVIENLITHPEVRRKGYGRAAVEMLLDYAKQKNCYKVMILSESHRNEAHEFYRSLGFDGDVKRGFTYSMK